MMVRRQASVHLTHSPMRADDDRPTRTHCTSQCSRLPG
ncbi:unnamed protein product [Haemonchus placei]|uniref:Uncharacterized protein n=1 Tax=Haemonchus placei TaxID=6290 RepID=A0A0N4W9W1_HAEPC|nr:unnamed protein product [Haemonchus placei]